MPSRALHGSGSRGARFCGRIVTRGGTQAVLVLHALLLTACGGDTTGVEPDGKVARIEIVLGEHTIPVGELTSVAAIGYDRSNTVVPDVVWTWRSEPPDVAVVQDGKAVGVSAGAALITATTNGITASRTLVVSNVNDVAILDARLTQGVQEPDQSIPIVLDGLPAVLNVLLRPRVRAVPPTRIIVRLLTVSDELEFADTAVVSGPVPDKGFLEPTVQFLIPAQHLRFGLRWNVVRDADGSTPDDSAHNDVFPRSGTRPLPIVEVPTLGVHFVPVRLAAEGGVTGIVAPSLIDSYMRDVRRTRQR